jgi:toxin ParE1/3/4
MQLRVTLRAQADVTELLDFSRSHFGNEAAERYGELIDQALADLLANPLRAGVRRRIGSPSSLRLYHLRSSRGAGARVRRVARPRHYLVFRVSGEVLELVRVLHERMDLDRALASLD